MGSAKRKKDILAAVRHTIKEYRMIPHGAAVIAAVSGGPDSVAMLHLLHKLSCENPFRIIVAHLNHKLRHESNQEAAFVRSMASSMGLECRLDDIDVRAAATRQRISTEEAGRRARYAFFRSIKVPEPTCVIATGHHLDDELETLFLRLFRGSSLQGLRGIAPVREGIIRPLIKIRKSEIFQFLEQNGIAYKLDHTNLQPDTDRNFIRNRLFPLIEERFEHFHEPLERTMELIRAEDQLIQTLSSKLYSETVTRTKRGLSATAAPLLQAPEELASRVILSALYDLSGADARWGRSHIRLALKVLRSPRPSAKANLGSGVSVWREYGRMFFCHDHIEDACSPSSLSVDKPGRYRVPGTEIILEFTLYNYSCGLSDFVNCSDKAYFDADQVEFPLTVRFPEPGDRFMPWGINGSQKLKKFLIDLKIPKNYRPSVPLLVRGDDILWIPGIRRSQVAPVRAHTTRVLEAKLVSGFPVAEY